MTKRKFFIFQPEELDQSTVRSVYNRLDEAKSLVRTLPGAAIVAYSMYPTGPANDFDQFLPIFGDKDWATRLKNDVIVDQTDVLFVNVPHLQYHIYLSLAWLLNQGYVPEDERQFRSLRYENLNCHIWDRERLLLEILRYRSLDNQEVQ